MENLIQPNLHPLIVHFSIAFLTTGPLLLVVSSFLDAASGLRVNMRIAGDWMLALGIAAVIGSVLAGLQAYYTIDHDGPSHLAMTDHRNWAFATSILFIVFGFWRFRERRQSPSKAFSLLLLIPVLLISITGWKGGHLVYQYGLGVSSLPAVSGDGHDHAHGDGEGHGEEPDSHQETSGSAHSEDVPTNSESPSEARPVHGEAKNEIESPEPDEHDHSGHEH